MFRSSISNRSLAVVGVAALSLTLAATGLWAAAAAEQEPAAAAARQMVANVYGEMVEQPQYGGTIAVAITESPTNFDP